ncbi:hypothetical protein I317_03093 [Kwoniella heveanensis CBS 569]|nr:hypothetical protein I317_03093 [Kwoniella heveanensis CBS 569]
MPSPPPPLILHRYDERPPSPEIDAINAITPLIPRDRPVARPIPIGASTPIQPPSTGSHSYSLGSQESTISDLSDSIRAYPPPLTTTSTLPTPYTIRTPATTEASSSSSVVLQQPTIASPHSLSIPHDTESPSEGSSVQAKSFPHNGDLLGRGGGGASSSQSSRRVAEIAPSEGQEVETQMEVDQDRDRRSPDQAASVRVHGERDWQSSGARMHSSPSGPGSLTRLLQEIGGRPSRSSTPVYSQPNGTDTNLSGESSDWRQAGPDRTASEEYEFNPGYNALGWIAPSAHVTGSAASHPMPTGSAQAHTGQQPLLGFDNTTNSMRGIRPRSQAGGSGMVSPADRSDHASGREARASRIAPVRSSSTHDAASRSSLPSDFRTLPSPVSNISSSGSPGALERRIDTIEARLERARGRGHRSPPTPPPPFAGHAYEGLRIRPNAARPYDPPPSRIRHFGASSEEASARSSFSGHSTTRPPWSDHSSASSSATVPPPRANPLMSFGWEPAPHFAPAPPLAPEGATRLLIQSLIEAESEGGASPVPRFSSPGGDFVSRPWYLQQRMNMLDSLRTGTMHPTATHPRSDWYNSEVPDRPDSPLRREGSDASDESTSFRHAFGVGVRDRSVQTPVGPFGMGWDLDERPPAGGMANPVRPANRRWMSFDEGERENSRERERERGTAAAVDTSIGALHRDINEVVGRRLSQVRPRSSSITRRIRDEIGPDWEDARVGETLTSSGSSDADEERPLQRPRGPSYAARPISSEAPRPQRNHPAGNSSASFASSSDEFRRPSSDEFATHLERARRNRAGYAEYGTGHRFGLEDAESVFLDRLRSHELFFTRPYGQDLAESMVDLNGTSPAFAYLNTLRRMQAASGPPLSSITFTPEMTDNEKGKIVQMVIKGMARLPPGPRKKAAEGVLEILPWGQFGEREGMDRDEYCSVCHDEYEEEVKIAVTPCKHMYHKDCLDTWLNTPNHSSCPMCRRDLAALACLIKMQPSKTVDEALPLWMNAAL